MDKEATDIWMFGKSRPDLSLPETIKAWREFHGIPENEADRKGDLTLRDPVNAAALQACAAALQAHQEKITKELRNLRIIEKARANV